MCIRDSPLAVVDSKTGSLYRTKVQTVNANPYLQVDFGKGIYAKTTLGVNITDQNIYTYYSALYDPNGVDSNGLGTDFTSKTSVITWTNVLGWNYTFNEKHAVNLMQMCIRDRRSRRSSPGPDGLRSWCAHRSLTRGPRSCR